jgi:hypothetical protein
MLLIETPFKDLNFGCRKYKSLLFISEFRYANENVDKIIVGNKADENSKRKVTYDEGY